MALPDFARLIATLNQTGMSQNNPPLYQFLKQLILDAAQSQAGITNLIDQSTTNISTNIPQMVGYISLKML